MTENKRLADKLDENLFSDKNFRKIYTFYTFWLILTPIIETAFACIGVKFNMIVQTLIISLMFFLTKILEISFNIKSLRDKKTNSLGWLVVGLFVWFMLSNVINRSLNVNFLYGVCYLLCFMLIFNVDKKHNKMMALVFICEMVFSTILGLIDLNNAFIPSFVDPSGDGHFAMSMQFINPNWSAFVVIIASMLCLWFIYKSEKTWQKLLLFVGFVILVMGLFVGGSYAPETSLFLCEFAFLIYLWIKNKKCPWWVLSAFLTSIFLSFFVWFFPAFRSATTASANYFYETLAVVDGKLHTHLVEGVSGFFNKLFGWANMLSVPGSDGWDRGDLKSRAYSAIFANPKSVFFGYGSAYIYKIRVHNCYLTIWMEFGTPAFLLYLAIFALIVVRFIKVKKTDEINLLFMIFCMLLFESLYCCIEPICYIFFCILVPVLCKKLWSAELKGSGKIDNNELEITQKF